MQCIYRSGGAGKDVYRGVGFALPREGLEPAFSLRLLALIVPGQGIAGLFAEGLFLPGESAGGSRESGRSRWARAAAGRRQASALTVVLLGRKQKKTRVTLNAPLPKYLYTIFIYKCHYIYSASPLPSSLLTERAIHF